MLQLQEPLVCDPEIILLLDEPLGALDLKLRKSMQLELKEISKKTEKTFIYVTHDQEEALTMSDTVVVMNNGSIEQIGTPEDIYNEPVNASVADFIGEANILNGIMIDDCRIKILRKKSLSALTRALERTRLLMLLFALRILRLRKSRGRTACGCC